MARMRITTSLKVNLIDKERLFKGKDDIFLDISGFIDPDDPNGEYGGTVGFLTQDSSKEEREKGLQMPILGNVKVTWRGDDGITAQQSVDAFKGQSPSNNEPIDEDSIPF